MLSDESAYRKGLVLGLTLAEIILLIIFSLLLILGFLLGQQKEERRQLQEELKSQTVALALQEERLQEMQRLLSPDTQNKFDDLFRELKLAQKEAERAAELEARVQSMESESELATKLTEMLGDPSAPPEQVVKRVQDLQEIAAQAEAFEEFADKDAAEEAVRLARELNTTKGQMQNLRRKLDAAGKGMEMPACWADSSSGRVEYIFDVALTSKGLVIHDNKIAHRAQDQAELPVSAIKFDAEMSLGDFRDQTRMLFDWSVSNECRFFVRVFDQTGASEKQLYKEHLRVLEEHFYKYVVWQDPFPAPTYQKL